MGEELSRILSESKHVIGRLQLMSAFFNQEVVYKIYLRTQVIHKLFETNAELDINKLELFHLQYTESVIALLTKIKKANEKVVSLVFDEIELNKELISRLEGELFREQQYEEQKNDQVSRVSNAISNLYQNLADLSADPPFPKEIARFSADYADTYFTEITRVQLEELLHFEEEDVYRNGYGVIHKKLMGLQCKNAFANSWLGGVYNHGETIELYQLEKAAVHFLFYPARRWFLTVEAAVLNSLHVADKTSGKAKFMRELEATNEQLEVGVEAKKKHLPADVVQVLENYYEKITEIDFLQVSNFDIQTNILKTMLNTDGL